MINGDDLRFFCVVASHPSLASAARSMNVTPPSVTQRLQHLEDKLKIKLIDRKKKASTLTDEGSLFYEKAKMIIADIDELQESIAFKKNEISGKLKVQAPLGFGSKYIAPLIAKFQSLNPTLLIDLSLSDNPDWSMGGAIDIIIHIGQLRDSSLKMTVLAPNNRVLCASPLYVKENGLPRTPADLREHQCIALKENEEDATMWRFTHIKSNEEVSIRIAPKMASNDGGVTKNWAMQGYGIIIRSEWDVSHEIASGDLVQLLPNYRLPNADVVALIGTEPRHRSARTVGFLKFLSEHLE